MCITNKEFRLFMHLSETIRHASVFPNEINHIIFLTLWTSKNNNKY